jgi:hypothetical protein
MVVLPDEIYICHSFAIDVSITQSKYIGTPFSNSLAIHLHIWHFILCLSFFLSFAIPGT